MAEAQKLLEPGQFYYVRQLIWLRRLLWRRRWRRKSATLRTIGSIGVVLGVLASLLGFFVALAVGIFGLPVIETSTVALIFAGLIYVFTFMRFISLVTGVQSGEGFPMDNLLHLPFSIRQVFYLNFTMAQINLPNLIFLPMMLALGLGSAISLGIANVLMLVFILVFATFMSAVLYQFQGWVVTSVKNKRNRLTFLYILMTFAVIAFQLPNIFLQIHNRQERETRHDLEVLVQTAQENVQNEPVVEDSIEQSETLLDRMTTGWVVSESSKEQFPWKLVIASLALMVLAYFSLRGSYRKTLHRYQAASSMSSSLSGKKGEEPKETAKQRMPTVLWQAIALISIKTFARSAFGKVSLIAPLNFLIVGGVFWAISPSWFSTENLPLIFIGIVGLTGLPAGIAFNLFALDSGGFGTYVFSGVDLKHLLLGKLATLLPIFSFIAIVLLIVGSAFTSLTPSYILAIGIQFATVFTLIAMLALFLSIQYPVAVSPTSNTAKGYGVIGFVVLLSELCVLGIAIFIANQLMGLDESGSATPGNLSYFLIGSILEFAIVLAFSLFFFRRITGRFRRRILDVHLAVTQKTQ